jgi:hypothetical protein
MSDARALVRAFLLCVGVQRLAEDKVYVPPIAQNAMDGAPDISMGDPAFGKQSLNAEEKGEANAKGKNAEKNFAGLGCCILV